MTKDVYTVFRRSDGYINSIVTATVEDVAALLWPAHKFTFEILLQTTSWREAAELIERERAQ